MSSNVALRLHGISSFERGFLLDTDAIPALSPLRAEASVRFLEWLKRMDGEGRLFLSVVSIHEIEKGIALLEHKGAAAKAAGLKVWLASPVATYDDKIMPLDVPAAALAGQLEEADTKCRPCGGPADLVKASGAAREAAKPSSVIGHGSLCR